MKKEEEKKEKVKKKKRRGEEEEKATFLCDFSPNHVCNRRFEKSKILKEKKEGIQPRGGKEEDRPRGEEGRPRGEGGGRRRCGELLSYLRSLRVQKL